MTTVSYACDPALSRGRLHAEEGGLLRGPRDVFQRDRDRIVHSIAFRRLRHKTQVFISPDGDHYRVRLTHSLEVAQIGRTIARALGLNEDLTEALCLAHDIGHPPFGHAGEDALQEALRGHGGFDHNAHTIRVLTQLEHPYPRWNGLNLSWELLEGLAKHNGPVSDPSWALAEADRTFALELSRWPSLEAQVAAIADDIAYDNHDIDDGIRAGILTVDQLTQLPFVAERWAAIRDKFSDVSPDRLVSELVRQQIGAMVNDVIDQTRANIAESGVETVNDIRGAGRALAVFSDEMRGRERALKTFMYDNLYHHESQREAAAAAQTIVADLFAAYQRDPSRMTGEWKAALPGAEPARSRHIADYLAGMTDRFAETRHRQIFGDNRSASD